eukprot:6199300-Pleurochrysis_carterae.AAC.2
MQLVFVRAHQGGGQESSRPRNFRQARLRARGSPPLGQGSSSAHRPQYQRRPQQNGKATATHSKATLPVTRSVKGKHRDT